LILPRGTSFTISPNPSVIKKTVRGTTLYVFKWKATAVPPLPLSESLDQPYPIKWNHNPDNDWRKDPDDSTEVYAKATLNDDTELAIRFQKDDGDRNEPGDWSVKFARNHSQEVTGEGNAQRIFATVLGAIQQFVNWYKPDTVTFSASKDPKPPQLDSPAGTKVNPQSRAKLYNRMVQRYASAAGYSSQQQEGHDKITYLLQQAKQGVAEVVKMPPTKHLATEGDWAYKDTLDKKATNIGSLKGIPSEIYDMGDHLRVFVLDNQGPVLYLVLEKFLDGFKIGAVAVDPRGRGQNLAVQVYQATSNTFGRPIYSDTTQTDASRIGIWQKLISAFPNRVVGYDQKTQEDLPLTYTDQGPAVRDNQPIYVQRNAKDQPKPMTSQDRSRTRLLKLLPTAQSKQGVAEGLNQTTSQLGPQLYTPHPKNLDESMKPKAALWTSTASSSNNGYTSAWVEWAKSEMPQWIGHSGFLYDVSPNARILTINSDQDAMRVAKKYGMNTTDIMDLFMYMPWKKIAKDYDAIHHVPSNRGADLFMHGWDVESTAWFNTKMLLNKRKVPISASKKGVAENFADGRNPQDRGDSQRHGIPKGATMAQLEKAAKAQGRKGQLARWQLNMRRGKKK